MKPSEIFTDIPQLIEKSIEDFSIQHPWTALAVSFGAGVGIGSSRNPRLILGINLPFMKKLSASSILFRETSRLIREKSE